ncbi:MAG: GFA family protein [Gammaproteobacteria bacterium]
MRLEGSCHCKRVRFRLESDTPYPYMRCYCSICRKTAGSGGYAINLGGQAETLEVEGREHVGVYRARLTDKSGEIIESPAERHFCRHCASALWAWDPRWPALIHPFASAIDTPLPTPPERVHIMLDSRANWCKPPEGVHERHFAEYPHESIADWHRRHGLAS